MIGISFLRYARYSDVCPEAGVKTTIPFRGVEIMDHCCEMMGRNLREGETAIRYYPKFREYSIPVLDGGDSSIQISFCPWCGHSLPPSLRQEWFGLLEARGLEAGDPAIPDDLSSDDWWRRRS
jgi:hypothetical protein